jgi:FtsP/CotA-like multicopper oxidase with cupredoxin domain
MKKKGKLSRRGFLRASTKAAAGAIATLAGSSIFTGCVGGSEGLPADSSVSVIQAKAESDLEVNLVAAPGEHAVFPGAKTLVWKYEGKVVRGNSDSLQTIPGSYIGPTFRVTKGQRIRVNLTNQIDGETIIHWHGLHLSEAMDAHPKYVIQPGETYQYDFQVLNRAGTYWYHPHPDGATGPQIYQGLAGFFLVSDDEEQQAGLPEADFDVPLVLQDRAVDQNNQWIYDAGGMMGSMTGMLGDRILVNGQPNALLPVAAQAYRLRFLNGSNSRIYKLGWEDGTPMTVIGTDGGLLEKPVNRPYLMLSPGERVEIWADFHTRPVGSTMRLISLPYASSMRGGGMMGGGMMGGMMGGSSTLANGGPFSILEVRVDRAASQPQKPLPEKLSSIVYHREIDAVNRNQPRTFALTMGGMRGMMGRGMMSGMRWTINGRTFEMEEVANDELMKLNTLETWVYDNQSGGGMGMMGGMMQMPHPMHIHGVQFQVIERQIAPAFDRAYQTVSEGFVDVGWKDTVLVMPGERVKLLVHFENFPGLFLHHCHNLEHEDAGMMRNFKVVA